MRKRVISLLLSLCMLLALVPATVIAESAQPTPSGLYCRWVGWDDNGDPFIFDDWPYLSQLDMKRTIGYDFVFYYTDDAGTTTRLSYEDLTFPDFLECRSKTEGDFSYIYLRPSAFGSGKITYVEANATLPVTLRRRLSFRDLREDRRKGADRLLLLGSGANLGRPIVRSGVSEARTEPADCRF